MSQRRGREGGGGYSCLDILLHETNIFMAHHNVVEVMYPQNVIYYQIANLKFETSNSQ